MQIHLHRSTNNVPIDIDETPSIVYVFAKNHFDDCHVIIDNTTSTIDLSIEYNESALIACGVTQIV
jgi:hypothetical protein